MGRTIIIGPAAMLRWEFHSSRAPCAAVADCRCDVANAQRWFTTDGRRWWSGLTCYVRGPAEKRVLAASAVFSAGILRVPLESRDGATTAALVGNGHIIIIHHGSRVTMSLLHGCGTTIYLRASRVTLLLPCAVTMSTRSAPTGYLLHGLRRPEPRAPCSLINTRVAIERIPNIIVHRCGDNLFDFQGWAIHSTRSAPLTTTPCSPCGAFIGVLSSPPAGGFLKLPYLRYT